MHVQKLYYMRSKKTTSCRKSITNGKEGYIVLCDRFVDSSLAYQGVARNLGIDVKFII